MPLVAPAPLETARLRIRLLQRSDLEALLRVNNDDMTTGFLPYPTWHTLADAQAWYQRVATLQADGNALQWVVADKHTDMAIGSALLFRFDEGSARAELGYVLGRAHWGQGYMREALEALIDTAFDRMALRRLEAEVDPRNLASAKLLQHLGFTHEGLLRQKWITKGEATDVDIFGLLRHEWQSLTGYHGGHH